MIDELLHGAEFSAFHEDWKKQTMIVRKPIFDQLPKLNLNSYPIGDSAAFRKADGKKGILINWDVFAHEFNQDFTACIDTEVEHEIYEMWLTRNRYLESPYNPHDASHYEAVKFSMRFAQNHQNLDKYLDFKRAMMTHFDQQGDSFALKELKFYEDYYQELSRTTGK